MDGSLDHERDSIDAERFLAVFESELFFDRTLREALDTALERFRLTASSDGYCATRSAGMTRGSTGS